jgi:hypothetical protein
MQTTVIVIKGDNTRSLLKNIADALLPEQTVIQEEETRSTSEKCPYTWSAKASDQQLKYINKFTKTNSRFKFSEIKNYVSSNTKSPIHNRLLSEELQKKGFIRVMIGDDKSTIWIRSV